MKGYTAINEIKERVKEQGIAATTGRAISNVVDVIEHLFGERGHIGRVHVVNLKET